MDIIEAPVNDHRAIGLIEKLILTIKNRLTCIKQGKSATNSFHIRHVFKIIVHQQRKKNKALALRSILW